MHQQLVWWHKQLCPLSCTSLDPFAVMLDGRVNNKLIKAGCDMVKLQHITTTLMA